MRSIERAKEIIIDTDPGHDDAMAIMLAVKSPEIDVKAITTVCGNSNIENTTRNTRYIVNLLNRNDIPIYSGAEKPLKRELVQAVVHGKSGLEGIDPLNEANLTGDAIERTLSLLRDNPYSITLVTLGPLTNAAQAIAREPETMMLLNEIIMMGGAIRVPGNKNRTSEFNMFVDPEAAQIVMNFPIKKTLVPLDACNHVQLLMEDFEQVENDLLREPLLKMVRPYITNLKKDSGINAALMYDPLTVFYLLSPESCTTGLYNIQIETKGEYTRGMTVADLRTIKDASENNCVVVENISSEVFKHYFIAALSRKS